jgi:hypothetical protein
MSSRILPIGLVVAGTGLALAAAWAGYWALEEGPQAEDLVEVSLRVAHGARPETFPLEDRSGAKPPVRLPASEAPSNVSPSNIPSSNGTSSSVSPPRSSPADAPSTKVPPDDAPPDDPPAAGVRILTPIELPLDDGQTLRAMAAGPSGELFVATALSPERLLERETTTRGRIRAFDVDGRETASWPIEGFVPQAVAVSADSTVYVGGQGRLASYTADGKSEWTVDLYSLQNLTKIRGLVRDQARDVRDRTIGSVKDMLARMNDQVSVMEELLNSGIEARRKPTARDRQNLYEIRSTVAERLADLERLSLDDWEQELIDETQRVDGIAAGRDELFVLYGSQVERISNNGRGATKLQFREQRNLQQIRSTPEGFVALAAEAELVRYDRDGKPQRTARLPMERSAGATEEMMTSRYVLGPVEADRFFAVDSLARVGEWSASGELQTSLFHATIRTGLSGARRLEVAPDAKRIYVGGVGDRRIVRLEYSRP